MCSFASSCLCVFAFVFAFSFFFCVFVFFLRFRFYASSFSEICSVLWNMRFRSLKYVSLFFWKKITLISDMLWGLKFRHLSQTNGRTDIACKGSCTSSTHIYSICIGFRLIRPKPSEQFRTEHCKNHSD